MNKNNFFQSKAYIELVKKNSYNTIETLLKEGIDFAIVCYTDPIEFSPPVPETVIKFDKLAMFIITGYTFESAYADKNFFYFEAGFGTENFGSFLKIPLEAITQILLNEDIITINYYEYKEKKEPKELNSMEILLQNPENLKLLKKKK